MNKIFCEFCGVDIDVIEESCPNCGAPNKNHFRVASDTPKTIGELEDWYKSKNLPDEKITRFFIGRDFREACAFGIYQDGDSFIVYKNDVKANRSVRYKGTDEIYAVNLLYIRLKEEILRQKMNNLKKLK